MPEVALVTTRYVDAGREQDYRSWSTQVQATLATIPGYVSAEQIPAQTGGQDFWTQIIRFSSKDASVAWSQSEQVAELNEQVDQFTHDSEVSAVRTGRADWLNFGFNTEPAPGAPIKWKQLLAGVMVLFPTVVVVHQILTALIDVPLAVSTLLTNAIAMSLVMLVWLPSLSKVLGYWLLPSEPLPAWKQVGTAVGCLVVIGLLTVIFRILGS